MRDLHLLALWYYRIRVALPTQFPRLHELLQHFIGDRIPTRLETLDVFLHHSNAILLQFASRESARFVVVVHFLELFIIILKVCEILLVKER